MLTGAHFLRVNSPSNKIHKVFKPFSVVNVRGSQVFQAVRRAKDVTVEYYMNGRLLLSATGAPLMVIYKKSFATSRG